MQFFLLFLYLIFKSDGKSDDLHLEIVDTGSAA